MYARCTLTIAGHELNVCFHPERPDLAYPGRVNRPKHTRPRPDPTSRQSPLPQVDELDESIAPPIASKAQPANAMDDVVPTLDDSDRTLPHHPNEPISEGFTSDPIAADAAADLAGEFSADFIEGATGGRDRSDVILSDEGTEGIEEDMIVGRMGDEDGGEPR
jgi:hypothetical protein